MARPPPKLDPSFGLWSNESQAPGYSYWLIFANFLVHALNCGMVSFYIYKKYKPRQTNKEVGIDVNAKANSAMIFWIIESALLQEILREKLPNKNP